MRAVPEYVRGRFNEAPPGHTFRLYFNGWERGWTLAKSGRDDMIAKSTRLPKEALDALVERQRALAEGASALVIDTRTAAPLVTGMGIEHPLENGFAFYDPHGVPYLPGSGIKGAVRRAAEELALLHDDGAWTIEDVWHLFGFDASSAYLRGDSDEARHWQAAYRARETDTTRSLRDELEAQAIRGSLVFWDAFPKPDRLRVDVMTPHFPRYHARGTDPATDDQDPQPIFFLTVPEDAPLVLVVELSPVTGLPDDLGQRWRKLVGEAVDHAMARIGFGAKTSLGYGLLERDAKAAQARERKRQAAERAAAERAAAEQYAAERERRLAELEHLDPAARELIVEVEAGDNRVLGEAYKRLDDFAGGDQIALARALVAGYKRLDKWDSKQSKKQAKKNARLREILGDDA